MGLLDSVRGAVSSVFNRVEQKATEVVKEKVAEVKREVGYSGESSFDAKSGRSDLTGADGAGAKREPKTASSVTAKKADNFTFRLDHPATEVTVGKDQVLKAATGPVPPALWDHPQAILSNLPQNSSDPASKDFCGPSSALGGAIMNGPAATAKLLKSAAADPANKLTAADRAQLTTLAGQVESKNVKFEDLSAAQGLLYKAGKTGGPSGMSLGEVNGMGTKYLGGAQQAMPRGANGADLKSLMGGLKPGESAVVMVNGSNAGAQSDHYITVGKSPDGAPYIYNPDPDVANGDKAMVRGDAIEAELLGYGGRVRPNAAGQLPPVTVLRPG